MAPNQAQIAPYIDVLRGGGEGHRGTLRLPYMTPA